MAEFNLLVKYTSELVINSAITVPNLLLKVYKKMGLTETELLLILHLWRFKEEENNEFPDLEELSNCMTVNSVEIQTLLAGLIEKKILSVNHLYDKKQGRWVDRFSYLGLFDQLMEHWAICKAKELEADENLNLQMSEEISHELFKTFEEEFGRLLSPFESNQIIEWCQRDNYSPDLILEALRKTSLRGIKNLKYVDSILLDWRNNGISTIEEVENYEKLFQEKQQAKEKPPKKPSKKEEEYRRKIEKYKDVYMN